MKKAFSHVSADIVVVEGVEPSDISLPGALFPVSIRLLLLVMQFNINNIKGLKARY